MPNPLYNSLAGQTMPAAPMMSNLAGMMNQFNQFRQSFQGDPKQMVQQLLSSGRMSQTQYNALAQMATQLQNMIS